MRAKTQNLSMEDSSDDGIQFYLLCTFRLFDLISVFTDASSEQGRHKNNIHFVTTVLLMILLPFLILLIIITFAVHYRRRNCIDGGFVIPGYPLVGNIPQVLNNPSKTFMEWSRRYRHPIFVIYLGSQPVVIVNRYKDIQTIWSRYSIALNSRPISHTFHNVISETQGPTIGTSPAGTSFRKKRKVLTSYLSAKRLTDDCYVRSIDSCSTYIMKNILSTLNNHEQVEFQDISLLRDFQSYVLRCAILMTYGLPIDTHGNDRALCDKIFETENHIINYRSVLSNYQDHLSVFQMYPLRLLAEYGANYWKSERDIYIDFLQAKFEHGLTQNEPNFASSILARTMSERSNSRILTRHEARSLCLTMISAGLDNLGFTMNYIIGQFSSSRRGSRLQERLRHEILASGDNSVLIAWRDTALSLECDFAFAIIHEALRKFSVLPLGIPRLTTKSFKFECLTIPKGTVVIMNVFAANHDPCYFSQPSSFNPDRWLDSDRKLKDVQTTYHLTFGSGSRKCVGDQLSVREMYTLLCRMMLVFRIQKSRERQWEMEPDSFRSNSNPAATSIEPKETRFSLRVREGQISDELINLLSESL